jgi:hypothetical protein
MMTRRTFLYALLIAAFVITSQLLVIWAPVEGFFSKDVEMTIACLVGGPLLFILGVTSVLSK